MGEPPLVREHPSPRELLHNLDRDLKECDLLRVLDAEWLTTTDLRSGVDALVEAIRARGGEVLFEATPADV